MRARPGGPPRRCPLAAARLSGPGIGRAGPEHKDSHSKPALGHIDTRVINSSYYLPGGSARLVGTEGATDCRRGRPHPPHPPPQHPLNCVYSLEKVIIEASCLDEKLTFSEDCSGAERGDKARVVLEEGGRSFLSGPSLLLLLTHLMSMDFMRSFSASEL